MANYSRGYVLADPGLGKTRGAIAAIDWIRANEGADPALVIAPLSILDATWQHEVFKWSGLTCVTLHGSKSKRLKLLQIPADIYTINYDGVAVILDELLKKQFGMLLLDESTAVKNASTDRFKFLNKIAKRTPRIFAMTGTPTPQGPMDAHGQIKMVTPCAEVLYKTRFKQSVLYQVSNFTWLPRPEAPELIHRLMQPAVRFKSEDCLNLPDMVYSTRTVLMTPKQAKAYKDMEKKLATDVQSGTITAANSAVMMGKLVQICSGFLYDDNKVAQPLPCAPRLKEVLRVVQQTPGKTIVFAGYTAAVNLVEAFLLKAGHTVAKVDGSVSAKARAEIFNNFQNAKDPQVLVAQERTASHGLTLTQADCIVWYTLPTSYEVFTQANFRIHRPSQLKKHYVVSLVSSEVERRLLTRLKNRESTQNILLDMYS
jgi:SNF2 family DNA or RNA helicase